MKTLNISTMLEKYMGAKMRKETHYHHLLIELRNCAVCRVHSPRNEPRWNRQRNPVGSSLLLHRRRQMAHPHGKRILKDNGPLLTSSA